MVYTNNVPQGNQRIADTQPLIQANMSYLDTALKKDHAFNGNEIDLQDPGTHQKISLPNQPVDITGALPTGIKSIEYCIGGNLYQWNGTTKNPISGYSGSGSQLLVVGGTAVITVPNDCIGYIMVQNANLTGTPIANECSSFGFFVNGGAGYTQVMSVPFNSPVTITIGNTIIVVTYSAGTIKIGRRNGSGVDYTAQYKYIYWPI